MTYTRTIASRYRDKVLSGRLSRSKATPMTGVLTPSPHSRQHVNTGDPCAGARATRPIYVETERTYAVLDGLPLMAILNFAAGMKIQDCSVDHWPGSRMRCAGQAVSSAAAPATHLHVTLRIQLPLSGGVHVHIPPDACRISGRILPSPDPVETCMFCRVVKWP